MLFVKGPYPILTTTLLFYSLSFKKNVCESFDSPFHIPFKKKTKKKKQNTKKKTLKNKIKQQPKQNNNHQKVHNLDHCDCCTKYSSSSRNTLPSLIFKNTYKHIASYVCKQKEKRVNVFKTHLLEFYCN